jgi:hypothetical protein
MQNSPSTSHAAPADPHGHSSSTYSRRKKGLYILFLNDTAGHFSGKKQPNWFTLTQQWSARCNGTSIFYKVDMPIFICSFICSLVFLQLPEQLKKYYKTWNANQNEANSVQQNQLAYKQLMNLLAVWPSTVPRIFVEPHTTLDQQIDPN